MPEANPLHKYSLSWVSPVKIHPVISIICVLQDIAILIKWQMDYLKLHAYLDSIY